MERIWGTVLDYRVMEDVQDDIAVLRDYANAQTGFAFSNYGFCASTTGNILSPSNGLKINTTIKESSYSDKKLLSVTNHCPPNYKRVNISRSFAN